MSVSQQLWLVICLFIPLAPQKPLEVAPASSPASAPQSPLASSIESAPKPSPD
jgi:hypothetical protein